MFVVFEPRTSGFQAQTPPLCCAVPTLNLLVKQSIFAIHLLWLIQNRCLSLQTWLGTLILNSFQHFVSNLPFFEYSLPLAEPLGGGFYYFTSEVDEYLLGDVIKDSLLNENSQKGEMAILLGLH